MFVYQCRIYRARNKGLQILLSNSHLGPGRKIKQEQEEISRNHVQAFFPGSVYLKILNSKSIYLRHDVSAVKSSISPWVSSWFMASAPRGVIITAVRNAVIDFWRKNRPPVEYFWLHR